MIDRFLLHLCVLNLTQKTKRQTQTLVHTESVSEKCTNRFRRHTRTVEANEVAASAVKNNVPEIVRYKCNNNNNINSNSNAEVNANNSKNATKPEVIRHHVTPMTSLPMALAQELELARKKEEEEQQLIQGLRVICLLSSS